MLNVDDAQRLIGERLGDTPRAEHSREVGRIMGILAAQRGADVALWTIVGLCHDLDYFAVDGDWSRHGLVTEEWLAGKLPEEALDAIAAHDHRTGRPLRTLLAEMLKLADTIANIGTRAGYEALTQRDEDLRRALGPKVFLADIFAELMTKHSLDAESMTERLRGSRSGARSQSA